MWAWAVFVVNADLLRNCKPEIAYSKKSVTSSQHSIIVKRRQYNVGMEDSNLFITAHTAQIAFTNLVIVKVSGK